MIGKIFALLKRTLTKWDLILIAFLILCTLASFSLWFKSKRGQMAVIMVDGEMIGEVSLAEQKKEISIKGLKGPSTIEILPGKVRMRDSTCPNKLCVRMGWISHEGQMICCIPNRVVIKIIGPKDEVYDAIAR